MKESLSVWRAALALLPLCAFAGQAPRNMDDVRAPVGTGTIGLPGADRGPETILYVYEHANFGGVGHAFKLAPGPFESTSVITSDAITAAGLQRKISSARLSCGTRRSRALLYNIHWGEFSYGPWLNCGPGETVGISDLSTESVLTPEHSRHVNDQVGAAIVVAHSESSSVTPQVRAFSSLFGAVWKGRMEGMESAKPTGTKIWLQDFSQFRIHQTVEIEDWRCENRPGVFELVVSMRTEGVRPVFRVQIAEVYVDTGFGDFYGCRTRMRRQMRAQLVDASQEMEASLPAILAGVASRSYYFVPGTNVQEFDVYY